MSTCTVDDCAVDATAKGLCAKHRMRQLRTGSTATIRRAGRPRDPSRALRQALFRDDWSKRTFERYWWAVTVLREIDGDEMAALTSATRPNGTANVTEFQRQATRALCEYVIREHP